VSVLGPFKLSKLRIERLATMGFQWSVLQRNYDATFEDRIAELREYYDEHGHLRVLQGYKGGRGKSNVA
jgi:hypothetical protein